MESTPPSACFESEEQIKDYDAKQRNLKEAMPSNAEESAVVTINELLEELVQEANTTRRVLERVPGHHLGWRPQTRSMSLGQLALHLANLPGAIAELATHSVFDVKTPVALPSATSLDQILSAHDQSVAKATQTLREMDDASLALPWKMVDGNQEVMTMPRSALLRSIMLNHCYHHRGQLTVYLRQVGALVPAVYGPSADENPLATQQT